MRGLLTLIAAAFLLASCVTTAPAVIWIRTDGQSGKTNPVLAQQFEIDRTVCIGETQKANMSGVAIYSGGVAGAIAQVDRDRAANDVIKGCMAQRGYLLVLESEAEAKSAQLRAVAEAKPQT